MYKKLIIFLVFLFSAHAQEKSPFVLLLGPSGTGKSTLIRHLKEIDSRFVYISPYTTRELRPGETDKAHISWEEMQDLDRKGQLLVINRIYDIYYATPKHSIDQALQDGNIPILDWPIDQMKVMIDHYSACLCAIYIEPENLETLKEHLSQDGRDKEGKRLAAGEKELKRYYAGDYDCLIQHKVVNKEGEDRETAVLLYQLISQTFCIEKDPCCRL